jgi:hypothetical protein
MLLANIRSSMPTLPKAARLVKLLGVKDLLPSQRLTAHRLHQNMRARLLPLPLPLPNLIKLKASPVLLRGDDMAADVAAVEAGVVVDVMEHSRSAVPILIAEVGVASEVTAAMATEDHLT